MLSCPSLSSENRAESEASIKSQGIVNTDLLYIMSKVSLMAHFVFKKYVIMSFWYLKAVYNTENSGVLKDYKCWFLMGIFRI